MKKILFIFTLIFLCINIRVKGAEVNNEDYLKKIQKDVIVIGVQNRNESLQDFKESNFAKYLKEELNLNIELKKVNEEEGKRKLLSKEIDFLENATLEENSNIKCLNYNFYNNAVIVCRDNWEYNQYQLAYKKVGIIDRNNIKNCSIESLNRNNNIKLYKDFNEMAKALENNQIDLGICDRENRFEILVHKNLRFCENLFKHKWKEGIATANPKYYNLINIINNNIYNNPNLIYKFFNAKEDYKKIIKDSFLKSLSNKEKEYIKNTKYINVITNDKSFPVFYKQNEDYYGILNNFMDLFNEVTNINSNYLVNKEDYFNKTNTIKESVCYENNKSISNIIYKTNLVMACLNKETSNFSDFDLVDKNSIGIPKQIKLNKNNELLKNDIKYYKDFDEALKGIKNKEVNFIAINKDLFDYYDLKENDKNIIEFKRLEIPVIYSLDTDNKILSKILTKVYKIYNMETSINQEKLWIAKNYMRKNYIKSLFRKKEIYKVFFIISLALFGILIIFIVLNKKNKDKKNDVIKKLDAILGGDSNLDIIEIDLKNKIVECKNGLIFNSKNRITLDKYLKIVKLNIDDYLNEEKIKININNEERHFKQYIYLSNNKKIIAIITDFTKEAKEKINLEEKIRIDTLTGLINRDYYEEEIQKIINKDLKCKGAFLFIDINDFKHFNDTYGHDFGDKVIKVIGDKLKNIQNRNTLAFRIAGDEFGIFKNKVQDKQEIEMFLKKLCSSLTITETYNDLYINVSCSIGCAICSEYIEDIGMLKNHAESEMYKCKKIKNTESKYKLAFLKENS